MNYQDALRHLHDTLTPAFYVEIGCRQGKSLTLAQCPSLAIDPDFEITQPLTAPTRIFRDTSDAFFARPDVADILGQPFDLAFIDGMHQAEFALRDFINLEAHAHPGAVIVIDDILPEQIEWTSRTRETQAWTGDVYKLIPLLRRTRPDLQIAVFDVEMKGIAVVHGLDPANDTLRRALPQHETFLQGPAALLPSVQDIRTALEPRPVATFKAYVADLARALPQAGTDPEPAPPVAQSVAQSVAPSVASHYLDLLKRSLLNETYLDDELRLIYLRACLAGEEVFDHATYHDIRHAWSEQFEALKATRDVGRFFDRSIHNAGFNHTMIGRKRLDSLHACLDLIAARNIPGDVIECGVWRGGASIFMAGYLKHHGLSGRKVLVADSFDGLPAPSMEQDAGIVLDKSVFPELAVPLHEVQANFATYGLLDDTVHFLKGWFKDTLATAPTEQLALLRLDGDLYESTMDTLNALYDKVVPGGIVIVDDWGALPVCRQAVEDFFAARNEPVPEVHIQDWTGVWFTKPGGLKTPEHGGIRPFKTAFSPAFLTEYQKGVMAYQYRDVSCLQNPLDMAIATRAIWELQPKTVIEIGSKAGGNALWLADLLQTYGLPGPVNSIDMVPPTGVSDPRIRFLKGDVHDLEPVLTEAGLLDAPHPWFVLEDSAHSRTGCLAALAVFGRHMLPGDLLMMQDGVLVELGLGDKYDGGPNRAIAEFMETQPGVFEIDTDLCDMFGRNATYAPNGFLRRM